MLQRSVERARARRSDEGFTLIELLIVIIILGVLAAIVVLSVSGVTNDSKKTACEAQVQTIDTAAEASIANGTNAGPVSGITLASLVPGFLHSAPTAIVDGKGTSHPVTTVGDVDAVATAANQCA